MALKRLAQVPTNMAPKTQYSPSPLQPPMPGAGPLPPPFPESSVNIEAEIDFLADRLYYLLDQDRVTQTEFEDLKARVRSIEDRLAALQAQGPAVYPDAQAGVSGNNDWWDFDMDRWRGEGTGYVQEYLTEPPSKYSYRIPRQ